MNNNMHTLPQTPFEVLHISNPILKNEIEQAVTLEKNCGFWKRPRKELAALLEEMVIEDMVDWACRSLKPVTEMENGEHPETVIMLDKNIIKLPVDFEKTTSVTFSAAGDLLYADGLENSKDVLFENISDILFGQDISYANFESPVTKQELIKEVISDSAAPIECCNRVQFDILTSHKNKYFTVLNTANNHMFDMGIEGLNTTANAFAEAKILAVGTNETPNEAKHGKYINKNGIKIGFVSYTFGLNGHQMTSDESYRINTANLLSKFSKPELDPIKLQIEDCKKQACDFVIVSMHWGFEFEFFPRNLQIEAAHALVEHGADAILCHHPHVIQPVEYYRTKRDPDRIATIAYSLGSVTWGYTAPHLALSIIQNLTLAKGKHKNNSKTYIEKADVIPVFRGVMNRDGEIITKIEKLSDHADNKSQMYTSQYIDQITQYAELVHVKENITNRISTAKPNVSP